MTQPPQIPPEPARPRSPRWKLQLALVLAFGVALGIAGVFVIRATMPSVEPAATATTTTVAARTPATPRIQPAAYELVERGKRGLTMIVRTDDLLALNAAWHQAYLTILDKPEGGYHVFVDCADSVPGQAANRLGVGAVGVGKLGAAQADTQVNGQRITWNANLSCHP